MTHPLDMLTGAEITEAAAIVRATGKVPEGALFAHIVLHEPAKDDLAQWKPGDPIAHRDEDRRDSTVRRCL